MTVKDIVSVFKEASFSAFPDKTPANKNVVYIVAFVALMLLVLLRKPKNYLTYR